MTVNKKNLKTRFSFKSQHKNTFWQLNFKSKGATKGNVRLYPTDYWVHIQPKKLHPGALTPNIYSFNFRAAGRCVWDWVRVNYSLSVHGNEGKCQLAKKCVSLTFWTTVTGTDQRTVVQFSCRLPFNDSIAEACPTNPGWDNHHAMLLIPAEVRTSRLTTHTEKQPLMGLEKREGLQGDPSHPSSPDNG